MILDAARIASRMAEPRPDGPRDFLLAFYPDAAIASEAAVDLAAAPLTARVNHGVWICSCDCGAPIAAGAPAPGMAVWLSVPWAWCLRCGNTATGGRWRTVLVPDPETIALIERILSARPAVSDRNWEPTETVADLIRQNLEAGDDVVPRSGAMFAPRKRLVGGG